MKQFYPSFNCIHPAPTAIDPYDQKSKLSKIQDGGSFLSVLTVFIVDAIQKQQILMQKTQQFIKGVKGVRVTRIKQQIFLLPTSTA